MSEKFQVTEITEKGRGVVAKQSLEEDEILFTEKPICSAQFSWGRYMNYRACFHCMKPLETPNEAILRLTIYGYKLSRMDLFEYTEVDFFLVHRKIFAFLFPSVSQLRYRGLVITTGLRVAITAGSGVIITPSTRKNFVRE